MSYTKTNWQNTPSTQTPISAANLNHMEQGIFDAAQTADSAQSGVDGLDPRMDLVEQRLDNLIPQGTPTQGNAELIDIRVGANGVTYPTAGDAVRGQVTQLKSALSQIEEHTKNLFPTAQDQTFTTSKNIALDISANTYTISAYITSSDTESDKCRFEFYDNTDTRLSFIDEFGNTVNYDLLQRNARFHKAFTVGSGVAYIRLYSSNTPSNSNNKSANWHEVQIELGSVASDYVVPFTAYDKVARSDISAETNRAKGAEKVISDNLNRLYNHEILNNNISKYEPSTNCEIMSDNGNMYNNRPKYCAITAYIPTRKPTVIQLGLSSYVYRVATYTLAQYANSFIALSSEIDGATNTYITPSPVNFIRIDFRRVDSADMQNSDITSIKNALTITETYDYIPYKSYLDTKADEINALRDDSGLNGDTFAFITDYHVQSNRRNSMPMLKYLEEHCGISFTVFGGDAQDFETTLDAATIQNGEWKYDFAHIKSYYGIIGNHEFNAHYHVLDPETYPESITLTYSMAYDVISKNNELQYKGIDAYGDYFIDNVAQKIRYLFLSCSYDAQKTNAEIAWVLNVFADTPKDYSIVVFSHMGFRRDENDDLAVANQIKKIGNGMYALNNRNSYVCDGVTYDYTNSEASAICVICGHVHYDADLYCDDNNTIRIIATTTDAYMKEDATYGGLARTLGTYLEQAFDIIHLDLKNKQIIYKRIGAGSDRTFSL